jgi:hypothetical protein
MNRSLPTRTAALAALSAALLIAGCASQAPTRTGFLQRYDEPVAAVRPVDVARYTGFVVDPIEFRRGTTVSPDVDDAAVARLKTELDAALRKVFGASFAPAAAPGPGVLRVRYAITGVETSQPIVNAVTLLLLGPVSNGGVSTEGEVVDSVTGERLAALVTASNGLPWRGGFGGYFDAYGHASALLTLHAEQLHGQLVPAQPSAPSKETSR